MIFLIIYINIQPLSSVWLESSTRTNGFPTEHILLNSRIHFPDQKLPVSSKYLKNFGLRFKCCQKLARISFTPPHGWTWPISTRKTARLGLVHATGPLKGSWVIKESWLLLWRCYSSGAVLGLGKAECGLATGRTKLLGVVLVSRAQFLAPFPVIFSLPRLPPSSYCLAVKASWKLSQSWCLAWPRRAVSQGKPGFFSDYPDIGIAVLTQTTTSTPSTMRRETDQGKGIFLCSFRIPGHDYLLPLFWWNVTRTS